MKSVYITHIKIEPPPAILKIDGKEQISGIGSKRIRNKSEFQQTFK